MQKFFILLIVSLFIFGCDGKKGELTEYEKQGKMVFRFTNSKEPATIDLSKATGVYENRIINLMFEGLMRYGDEGVYSESGVAVKHEVKEAGKTYIFTLRKNAVWSDGHPVDAHDFVAAYHRILDPKTASQYAYMLYDLVNAEAINKGEIEEFSLLGAKALDDHTLEIKLNSPVPYFMDLLTHYTFFPIPKHVVEKHGDNWIKLDNIVGNGAFVLKKHERSSQMVFHKSLTYWEKEKVKLDIVIALTNDKQETLVRMYKTGLVDWLSAPIAGSEYPAVKNNKEWLSSPYLGTYFFAFNTKKAPFDDPRVRKALAMSIDRKLIVDKITQAGQTPAFSYVPKGIPNYETRPLIDENIKEAKRLLAEAGYPGGKDFPEVSVLYDDNENHRKICINLQFMWGKRLGIKVKIENNEWKTYIDRMKNMDYDIVRRGWIADYNDAFNFMELFMEDGGNNNSGWANKKHDQLVLQTKTETDPTKRKALFMEAETILMEECPIIPIYFYVGDQLVKPYVRGFYPRIQGNDHGMNDVNAGKYNEADNHPIRCIWIDMEAKKKYLGIETK